MSSNPSNYGATPEEWANFDLCLGLTRDLLPVVANPDAKISAKSKMRDKGKVPSIYNRDKEVVGMSEWTRRETTEVDIERWARQADYGICIQTREVRALDIDVTDPLLADRIRVRIELLLGMNMPTRYRDNSSKILIAFRLKGNMPKRVIRVTEKVLNIATGATIQPAQIIEFLATGQQFVACGTHSSGARLKWYWADHADFPEITLDQFNDLWAALEKEFACAPSSVGNIRKRGDHFEAPDELTPKLIDKGLVLGEGSDGQLFIECPWKDGHSMDSGVTETAYFPRGTGGYELGHFVCMHAGCKSHSDTDFEEALGLRDDMFETLPAVVETDDKGVLVLDAPRYTHTKQGEVDASLYNLALALERPDQCGRSIAYDTFRNEMLIMFPGKPWRPMTDGDIVNLRRHLERVRFFKPIGREIMRDALTAHAEAMRIDSAIEFANSLPKWDGVERVRRTMADYYGAADTPYADAVSRYLWTALAGRALVPGIKADMAVILQGDQGLIKSTAIMALVPSEDLFTELNLSDDDEKLARLMRGKLIAELGELRGFYSREFEAIKAWIVRRFDSWVPKYKEMAISALRRCVLVGTTNHAEFLIDETGHRRFLPITVGRADINRLVKDNTQLWAEAVALFKKDGIHWQDAERLAKAEHAKFTVHDSWEEIVSTWLQTPDIDDTKPIDREWIKTSDVLSGALNIDARGSNTGNEKRVAKVLKALGYERTVKRVDGRPMKVFARKQ